MNTKGTQMREPMARPMQITQVVSLCFLGILLWVQLGQAEPVRPKIETIDYPLLMGPVDGYGSAESIAEQHELTIDGAQWIRVRFGECDLGDKSYITLRSSLSGETQRLDAKRMKEWFQGSAIFAGDRVELSLHVAPGDEDVTASVEAIVTNGPPDTGDLEPGTGNRSLCGNDDRVPWSDNRVGRLYFGGCTAWRASNGAFLTAGHCVDLDPDGNGPLLPDGVLDLFGVVEFNVPFSDTCGVTAPAAVVDQFPIDLTTVVWRFDGSGQGLGKDWAVFEVNPNSEGAMPYEAYQGMTEFRLSREIPTNGSAMRVTGCGVDNTPTGSCGNWNQNNMILQSSTGTYLGETVSGPDIWHTYDVDTTGGNSGSPVMWPGGAVTIGIHTNAGCPTTGNRGTSFEVNALETALQNVPGPATTYVDQGHPLVVSEAGTVYRPFDTVNEGRLAVTSGGTLAIVAGSYNETMTFDDPMTIVAPIGGVIIGSP